jgi:gag-polypeptide of LTR copia-type
MSVIEGWLVAGEEIDEESESGKMKSAIIELNEIAYTKLILSIDIKTSSGKVAFNLIKGCKSKNYSDGNAAVARERLKNKYEPISAPSLVKLEKQFRELSLKKDEDPEVWITELENLRVRLEAMDSSISENQFMIHILNNLTSDYELQLAMMERRVGDIEKPHTVEEIKMHFLVDSLKGSVEVVAKLVTSCSNAKIVDASTNNGNTDRPNFDSQAVVFTATASYERINEFHLTLLLLILLRTRWIQTRALM